jgi:hypothetical protein
MAKVSVVLPAREEPFLQRTVDDLFAKAAGDIEVIAVLDGWSSVPPPLKTHPKLRIIQWATVRGLRPAINAGMAMATGEYVMKLDAHCAVSPGFDEVLQRACDDNCIVVPTKYSLQTETWGPRGDPWQHFYLTYPWSLEINHVGLQDKVCSRAVHARYAHETPLAEIVTFQGSAWLMRKTHWDKRIGPMDAEHYYYAQEPTEIGCRTWLGSGRVLVHKEAWYAHLWKGSGNRRGFPRMKLPWARAHAWSADYWFHDRWRERVHDFKFIVEKFWDVLKEQGEIGGWPDDWQDPKYELARKTQDAGVTTTVQIEVSDPMTESEPEAPAVIVPTPQSVVSDTLQALLSKYQLSPNGHLPVEIKGMVRTDLPELFKSWGFTRGAEIGVWKGEFAELFCKAGLSMIAVDPWIGYPEYIDHRRHGKIAGAYQIAVERLAPFECKIIRKFSVEAAKDVQDDSLDFVYIDGNHSLLDVVQDLTIWTPKVRAGGIISGHDYDAFPSGGAYHIHVKEAVEAFTTAYKINPWFILGRRRVRPGERHERPRSFLWVKP